MKYFKGLFKHPICIIVSVIILAIIVYLLMLWDTNPLIEYARDVFYGEIPNEEIENTPWSKYDTTHNRDGVGEVVLGLRRVFVIHNFFDGYMWITYENIVYDDNGELLYLGTQEFPKMAMWKIHKENGEWILVEIDEHP